MYKIFLFLCMFLGLSSSPAMSQELDVVPVKRVISLELKDKPLKLVADEIFKQTGYRVVFDEKWNDLPLSGHYAGVTLEEFLQRSLRKQNVTLSYDDKGNVAILRFFGDRDIGEIKAGALVSEKDEKVQVSEEVKEMYEQQYKELQTYLKDPEAVDPVSGMKLVDIEVLQSTQQRELEQLRNDPEMVDPVSGMSLGDIKMLQNTQQAELERLRNDPETVDPISGMTMAEIKKLHDVQRAELEQMKMNPSTDNSVQKGKGENNG